jgi:diguanylate cyclase (GGDEF)-like protein
MTRKSDRTKKKAAPKKRASASTTPMGPSELVQELWRLLEGREVDLAAGLQGLEASWGDTVYVELLFLLAHLRFKPREARQHWRRITSLQGEMAQRLGSTVDIRVALVSYFVDVSHKLKNPKVIELHLFEETQKSAYRDELTGLYNYRYFREQLPREIERYERYGSTVSLLMIDIDDFKHYNDQHGHQVGNDALIGVARLLKKGLRGADTPLRYGGEEFAVILPSTPKDLGLTVAERVRTRIAEHPFPHSESQPGGHFTVSLGLATCPADALDADGLLRCADRALYAAKGRGKNRTYLYGEDRRSFRRMKVELEGTFCEVDAEFHPFTTLDVSEGSLFLVVDQNLEVGSLLTIRIGIPEADTEVACAARVIRVEQREDGRFRAAIRITEISQRARQRLVKFIQAEHSASE